MFTPVIMTGNVSFDKAKGFLITGLTDDMFVKLIVPLSKKERLLRCWDTNVTFTIDLQVLSSCLRGIRKGDIIGFKTRRRIINGFTPTINLLRWNDVKNVAVKLPVLDNRPVNMEPLDVCYDAAITIPAIHFNDILKNHIAGAEEATLRCIKSEQTGMDVLEIISFGAVPLIHRRPLPSFAVKGTCDSSDNYPIKSLLHASKAYMFADTLIIHLTMKRQIKLSYRTDNGNQLDIIIYALEKNTTRHPKIPISKSSNSISVGSSMYSARHALRQEICTKQDATSEGKIPKRHARHRTFTTFSAKNTGYTLNPVLKKKKTCRIRDKNCTA